ncbi:hypothetical protein CANMA_000292 [Candida margitis]|uniref:uncharacterized protein n=1 Tax=Candida margitis TaxID=1775924 RepID=UPI0022280903|nr:uncharacterized protein CANMA_000292 [Candida margitis]KAI5970701.1 hypothetical protein CANMA_000292 [Candida margitis]
MVSKSSVFTTILLAAAALAQPIYSNTSVIHTQIVVTDYTTFCPEATTFTITKCSDNHCLPTAITVTEPTTVTITDQVLCSTVSTIQPPASATTHETGTVITGENSNTKKATETTVYTPTTTVVTITTCSNHKCHPTEVTVTTTPATTPATTPTTTPATTPTTTPATTPTTTSTTAPATTPATTPTTAPTTTNTPELTIIPDVTVFPDVTPTGTATHTDEGPVFLSIGEEGTPVTVTAPSTTASVSTGNNAPAPLALSDSTPLSSSSSSSSAPGIAPLAEGSAGTTKVRSLFMAAVVIAAGLV